MVACLGGGATQAAVLAMYGIVSAETMRAGGQQMDEAIVNYTRRKYGIIISNHTAEQLKIKIGAAAPQDTEQSMEVQGLDQVTSLPRPVTLTTGEIVERPAGAAQGCDRNLPPRAGKDAPGTGLRHH